MGASSRHEPAQPGLASDVVSTVPDDMSCCALCHCACVGVRPSPQIILALGIALCIVIVIFAKKALKKLTEQELQHEAELAAQAEAEAAAAAAEAGTAAGPPGALDSKGNDSLEPLDQQKRPLPLAVEGKLAAAGAGPLEHKSTGSGSGSDGDLQVIVMDNNATAANAAASPAAQGSALDGVSWEGSLIPTAQMPPAATGGASMSSRASSVSSMRGLLSGFFQRSS